MSVHHDPASFRTTLLINGLLWCAIFVVIAEIIARWPA